MQNPYYNYYHPIHTGWPNNQPSQIPAIEFSIPIDSYNRQTAFPEVNPTEFVNSSKQVLILLQDAQVLSQSLIETEFAKKIMDAAQQSKTELLKEILSTLPINSKVNASYTPNSVTITFTPIQQSGSPVATVTLNLVWNKYW